ncbi:MAG TPA: hypothetical protein VGL05_20205 [Kribbella sp.]
MPRLVGTAGSGRPAARRACEGSGSVPMDWLTHDGVPPAGRRLARPEESAAGTPELVSGLV